MNKLGFTIIEVLFASLILSVIGILAYAALFGTFQTQKIIEEKASIQEMGTILLNKVREDFSQTFYVESMQPKTQFLGEDKQNKDKVTFTTTSHYATSSSLRESDQAEVTYRAEDNPEKSGLMFLQRKESPYFWNAKKDDSNEGYVNLADNILAFNLEYGDGERFLPSWNIRSRESLNKLPKLIKISITLQDEKGREENFETITDLAMSENIGSSGAQVPGLPGAPQPPGTGQTNPVGAPPTPGTPQKTTPSQNPGGG